MIKPIIKLSQKATKIFKKQMAEEAGKLLKLQKEQERIAELQRVKQEILFAKAKFLQAHLVQRIDRE